MRIIYKTIMRGITISCFDYQIKQKKNSSCNAVYYNIITYSMRLNIHLFVCLLALRNLRCHETVFIALLLLYQSLFSLNLSSNYAWITAFVYQAPIFVWLKEKNLEKNYRFVFWESPVHNFIARKSPHFFFFLDCTHRNVENSKCQSI